MKRSFLIIVLFASLGNAQSDLEVLGYNLLFGTLTSGFGSAINKTP